ncbi:hypothetical protein [Actinoplanes sp. URMC 104]|uniref:hypothetical protein n=1 Tax=Actinoplanes sp. URMC 104 TaxID=3423409 RepID=UPI003F1BD732
MRPCPALCAAVVVVLTAGCGTKPAPLNTPSPSPSPSLIGTPASVPSLIRPPSVTAARTPSRGAPSPAGSSRARTVSGGWEITVYYTAVERFHDGEPARVTGCRRLACTGGDDDLGSYPADFVQAVQDEGTGRTAAGAYLNWSYDVGFWLDTAPRGADGRRLVPFVSAAADPDVLPYGTRFSIVGCGRQDDGSVPPAATCASLRGGGWRITDEFTPGLGGDRHIDAYIGAETGPGFTDSDRYVTLTGARLAIG